MSGLGRLFGREKKERGPTPEEAIQKLKETEKILIKKQEFLEQKIEQELQTAKKHGTKNKRAALQALRRKKRLEQQLAQTDGTLSTLEFQREAIENATTNAEVLRTMDLAAQGMKKAYQDMDIDKVDELMADITEQQEVAQQISDAISRPVGFGDDVDEDELLEELEELEQEELARELLHVGDKEEEPPVTLPSVPSTHLPAGPGSAALRMTVLGHPGSWSCRWLPLLLLLLLGTGRDPGVEGVTHYKAGDPVILYVNKVGPYHNPQETYHYYQLPVCCPEKIRHKSLSLGEVLDGDRMAESLYEIRFRENVEKRILCHMQLSSAQVEQLRQAIEELYYFEFVVDDLPIRGFVGYMEESGFLPHSHKIGLWTHLDFHLEFHGDRIIFANVSVRDVKPHSLDGLRPDEFLGLTHTYSVRWSETSVERRSDRRRGDDGGFFPRTLEIHWLSIINSMVLVFLLVGFVAVILMRVLRNDLARYNLDEETTSGGSGDDFDQGDNGWKIIHTDVFRFPPYRGLLCAVLGVGAQFLALGTGIIVMALLGMFNVHRHGAINSAAILLYALTCCISGYVSSHFYRQIGGERWVWNIILTTSLFSVPFFLTWSVVNSVHWANGSTQALPATTILLLLTVWLLVGFPLTVIGGIFGKNNASPFDAPCRTKNIAREIPPQPWYKSSLVHMTVGGFLPFSAISVELYYIFATVWGREQYTLYGILFFVFAILLSVGACISIALTYFQLSGEDYRWWWRSVLSVGSTGLFIFFYSVFYYARRSNMSGVVQTVEFFGYSLLTGYVFFLMLGTISFFSSLKFIRYIYVNLKMD
ncbi:transmembrane 9 superfamily member 1 isoform X1 [Tursiops truncatus]|uniref:Transmembrane 9 superfamily member n=2 Tax=Delphinidae TaxID=9726 RepID=A0A6J3QXS7_TURTR|nr:transmembrane 9 superfamily member 1 isoform X2 [Tursiops truncatus]